MRLLFLCSVILLVVQAEYDDSLKCTVCTKVANYIIPAIREAGSDAVDNVCDTFTSDSIRSACGQIVGTGWSMIVNWVKYRKAGPRDICVSVNFCENGGRDLEHEDAESGRDRGENRGSNDHDIGTGGAGGIGTGGVDNEKNGRNGDHERNGGNGRDENDRGEGERTPDRSRSHSPDRPSGGDDLNFGAIDAERERQAERERNEELGRGRREAVQRYRDLMAQRK